MPSSTSSSEPRPVPAGSWRATWLLAIAVALGLLGLCEYEARHHGQRPSVLDDPTSWAMMRHKADGDRDVVAFVGTSRTVLGASPGAFAALVPGARPIQLGIDGLLPFTVLHDLAEDPAFHGLVILDFIERDVPSANALHDPEVAPYLARYHGLWRAPGAIANRYLAGWVQSWVAVIAIKAQRLLPNWLGRRIWPTPTWVAADRDRVSRADYRLAPAETLERKRAHRLPSVDAARATPAQWLATIEREIEPQVRQIRAHGGDVVVIHMPTTGAFGAAIERAYPRAQYWDVFARTSSAHVLHFRDIPAMAQLECGDEMHLDGKDQAAFTIALVDELRRRRILP